MEHQSIFWVLILQDQRLTMALVIQTLWTLVLQAQDLSFLLMILIPPSLLLEVLMPRFNQIWTICSPLHSIKSGLLFDLKVPRLVQTASFITFHLILILRRTNAETDWWEPLLIVHLCQLMKFVTMGTLKMETDVVQRVLLKNKTTSVLKMLLHFYRLVLVSRTMLLAL